MWIGRPLIHRRHEEFFKSIDQSIAVMEFRVYVFFFTLKFYALIESLCWIALLLLLRFDDTSSPSSKKCIQLNYYFDVVFALNAAFEFDRLMVIVKSHQQFNNIEEEVLMKNLLNPFDL